MKWFLLLLFTSCSFGAREGDLFFVSEGFAPKQQKLKIANLQRKLEMAESTLDKANAEVDRLKLELASAQIEWIQCRVRLFEQEMGKHQGDVAFLHKKMPFGPTFLFSYERELLNELVRSGPSPSSFEAQIVLDQILQMITLLSD